MYKSERMYISMEVSFCHHSTNLDSFSQQMHRERVGKFLDDSFTRFDHLTKANVCFHAASLYREVLHFRWRSLFRCILQLIKLNLLQIAFNRKYAFFSRLGVLFRLHMDESKARNVADYRSVFPILYGSLPGYGIPERTEGSGFSYALSDVGPVALQIKAVHEVC